MIENKLRIPAGNTYATAHRIVANDLSGQPIPDFDLQQCTDIQVLSRNGGNYKPVANWTTDDQLVIVLWYGKQMKLGGYDLYIEGKFNGVDWRYSEATIFEIVQFSEEANIPADTILVGGTYFMDAEFTLITQIQGGGGGGTPSDDDPLMDGTASAGTETKYSRGDHCHPSDTSKQDVISDLADIRAGAAKGDTAVQPADIADMATESYVDGAVSDEETRATGVEGGLQDALDAIDAVIPSAASSVNQLADKDFVNSSISTNTATFKGTYNSLAELQQVTATNNDYAFVIETDADGNQYYDRYKYNGSQWLFEYKVESTPFTAAQWAAIQSGITSALVTKLSALPTASQLSDALAEKQDEIDSSHKLSADLVDDNSTTNKFVTDTEKAAWNGKQDTLVSGTNIKTINNESLLGSGDLSLFTPVNNHGTSDTTFALTPNIMHIWGTVASLTLTLATPTDATIVNEYMFEFTSGSTATTLSLPATVEWAESCGSLSVEASKTYQVSIVNNIGLWTAIANS